MTTDKSGGNASPAGERREAPRDRQGGRPADQRSDAPFQRMIRRVRCDVPLTADRGILRLRAVSGGTTMTRDIRGLLVSTALAGLMAGSLAACGSETPAENAGEKAQEADKAADKAAEHAADAEKAAVDAEKAAE